MIRPKIAHQMGICPKEELVKKYEQMFILATDTEGDKENELVEKLKNTILEGGGEILESTRWGKRRLAYEIRKQIDGIYWYHVFNAPPEVPAQLRRIIRITEGFIRDMLIDLTYADKAEVRRQNYLKNYEKRKAIALSKRAEKEENDSAEKPEDEMMHASDITPEEAPMTEESVPTGEYDDVE